MLMVFFYTPWKHQKIRDFLMFLGSIERNRVLKWVNHIVLSAMTTVEDLGVDKILSWITINRISFNGQFWCWPNPNLRKKEISHTCEESGAHPRISVWHLLMNLKNNYLLKKLLKWANKEMWEFQYLQYRKTPGDIIILHLVYQKSWLYDLLFLRYIVTEQNW